MKIMLLNTSNISSHFSSERSFFTSKLSDSGRKSISWNFVWNFYEMSINCYKIIDSSLQIKRNITSGAIEGIDRDKLYHSPRLKYELTCLITTLLKNL